MNTEREPLTRCEQLPEQVGSDLALILFWCQHYGGTEEMEAAERLIDYFAETTDATPPATGNETGDER